MNRIEKRAIEALAVAPLIREISARLGYREALAVAREVNEKEAFERGRKMAEEAEGHTIEFLAADVATWGEGGVWEMEVVEQTSTAYVFNVHRCPYYEKYRELGLEQFGVVFSCCRDAPFASGLNPRLKLVRTKTIMEGADLCDFSYHLLPEDEQRALKAGMPR